MTLDLNDLKEIAAEFDWAVACAEEDLGPCPQSVYAAQGKLAAAIVELEAKSVT